MIMKSVFLKFILLEERERERRMTFFSLVRSGRRDLNFGETQGGFNRFGIPIRSI